MFVAFQATFAAITGCLILGSIVERARINVPALGLASLAIGWMAGRATNDAPTAATSADAPATERKVLYYRNPMGLPDTSRRPVP